MCAESLYLRSYADLVESPDQPRWLDADERQTWQSLARVLVRLRSALDSDLQRDAGISHFDYQVMAALSEAPQRTMRLSDVAARTDGSLPRLSQVVCRLEKRGWVERRPDPADGRTTLATLTEAGWDKIVATAPGHVEAVRQHVFDPLTKAQQRQLLDITQRITRTFEPERNSPNKR